MIRVDNKIRNIYYMLCYAFNRELLTERDISSVGTESFDNIYNLFSIILAMMIRKQIKKGINKDYINETDSLPTVRGKINLSMTMKSNSLIKQKIVCDFDEFSENNQLNQIIKTTASYLINSNKIGKETKIELKKSMIYFNTVDIINVSSINWQKIMFNRNNNSYKSIMVLCELILKGLIASDKNGEEQFKEFLDETALHRIYENFIRAYFRKHYNLKAGSRNLSLTEEAIQYIGMMKTDITLETEDRMLIIDAKFYTHILHASRFGLAGSKILNMGNIYQINTYVENQLLETGKRVQGMLLYAQTIDEPVIKLKVPINRKEIFVRTLDLNGNWDDISGALDEIANGFIHGDL